MGNGPTKLSDNLLAKAIAIRYPHRSAVIRFADDFAFSLYTSPGLLVNACCRNSVVVGPGQNIDTSISGCSALRLSK